MDIFRNIILPLRDRLFRTALWVLNERSLAEDVVQDVMLKLWSIREEWKTIHNLEAYCYRMARNYALNRQHLMAERHAALEEGHGNIPGETGFATVERHEEYRLLLELIRELPEKQRAVIELRELEGMSYREISAYLEIPEEQVKINLFRARQKVKELFLKTNDDGKGTNC